MGEKALADIATRTNVNPALIRYYFGSKDALITASVMSQLEALQRSTEAANDGDLSIRDKFVQRLKTIIGIQQDNPHFYQLLLDRADLDVEQNGENLLRKMADRGVLTTVELLYSKSDVPVRSVDPRFLHVALAGGPAVSLRPASPCWTSCSARRRSMKTSPTVMWSLSPTSSWRGCWSAPRPPEGGVARQASGILGLAADRVPGVG